MIVASLYCIRLSYRVGNYTLKTDHFNMLPTLHGLSNEDPLSFIHEFCSAIQMFLLNGISKDDLQMRYLPCYLMDRAKYWLLNLPEGSLRTWKDVYNIFMVKYDSPQKIIDLRNDIAHSLRWN